MSLDWFTEPWSHAFMQNALLAAVLVGIICGVIGTFVILKGMAFMGDALAHAIFPGVVIAYITDGSLLIGALIAAIVVSMLIGFVSRSSRIRNDTAIGVMFAGAFALGIALISRQQAFTRDLTSFLIGSILGVSDRDLILTASIGAMAVGMILYGRRELSAIAFDPIYAEASGIKVRLVDQLFLIALALAIVVSLQTVGNILVLAMLVTPAATARLLTDKLVRMVMLAAAIGAFSGLAGLYLSYYGSVSSGASIVLVATAIFLVVYLFAPTSGCRNGRNSPPNALSPSGTGRICHTDLDRWQPRARDLMLFLMLRGLRLQFDVGTEFLEDRPDQTANDDHRENHCNFRTETVEFDLVERPVDELNDGELAEENHE